MRKCFSELVGKLYLVMPTFIFFGAVLCPSYVSAKSSVPSPTDENNLMNVNACENFSTDNSVLKTFKYVLNGTEGDISATMFPELTQCLNKLKMKTAKPDAPHAVKEDTDDALTINNIPQTKYLEELAKNIENITADKNDQARIVVSIVQGFRFEDDDPNSYNYPYEVAYNQAGICNETAKLMINLFKQLGFGTAMLTFEKDNHQVAGIKCDPQYSYQDTGFCYVEPTTRAAITDDTGIKSEARVNIISDGLTFDASQDYQDAQKYVSLLGKKHRGKLNPEDNTDFSELRKKYGIG